MVVRNPDTKYINHKIAPSEGIVSWLAAPQSESEIKEKRGIDRLAAMDWGPYPLSADPEEIDDRKEKADGDGNGEKVKKTLDRLIDYVGDSGSVVAGARYQGANSLSGGVVVGSIGHIPEKENQSPNVGKIVMVLAWEKGDGEVVDAVPVEPGMKQEDVLSRIKSEASELGKEIAEGIVKQGKDMEESEEDGEQSNIEVRGHRVYALQGIEFNRDADWVWNRHFPLFSDIQHRGTTRGWNKGSDHLRVAYATCLSDSIEIDGLQDFYREVQRGEDGISLPTGIEWTESGLKLDHGGMGPVSLLSSGQLETLCNEFLRVGAPELEREQELAPPRYKNVNNVYPVGGKLEGVDIIAVGTPENGESERVDIVAQVSFETGDGVKSKIEKVANWVDRDNNQGDAFYFGPEEAKKEHEGFAESIGVTFLSIQDVFRAFEQSNSGLREEVLEEITRVPSTSETPCPEYPISESVQ